MHLHLLTTLRVGKCGRGFLTIGFVEYFGTGVVVFNSN